MDTNVVNAKGALVLMMLICIKRPKQHLKLNTEAELKKSVA